MKKKVLMYILIFIILVTTFFLYSIVIKNRKVIKVENNDIDLGNGIYATVLGSYEEENFDNNKREKITDYNLGSVYFYDIEDIKFNYEDKILNLKEALVNNEISIEQVIIQVENDSDKNMNKKDIVKDGGSIKYKYSDFSIIRFNTLGGNKDIYIGKPEMSINVLKKGY